MFDLLLALNIDHIATIRNLRNTKYPDPIYAACIAEASGVDGITVHLREDRRHITERDVFLLKKITQTTINLEIAATPEMIDIACKLKPHYCCLVPEKRQELTTESGLNLLFQTNKLKDMVSKLIDFGIRVSLFIDPNEIQIDVAYEIGVSCIELHTGTYAETVNINTVDQNSEYQCIKKSIQCAKNYGLIVNAGHGLNYYNVKPIAKLNQISELNIGHSIISRSMLCGLPTAISDMKKLLKESRRGI